MRHARALIGLRLPDLSVILCRHEEAAALLMRMPIESTSSLRRTTASNILLIDEKSLRSTAAIDSSASDSQSWMRASDRLEDCLRQHAGQIQADDDRARQDDEAEADSDVGEAAGHDGAG